MYKYLWSKHLLSLKTLRKRSLNSRDIAHCWGKVLTRSKGWA